MGMEPIYLDHNATSPTAPEVVEAMAPHWLRGGNPESRHAAGRAARRALEGAREVVARVLNAMPTEVVFTSGGTEANNLGVLGLAGDAPAPGGIVSSPIEHPAVAEPVAWLESRGWDVGRPAVDAQGRADAAAMAEAIGPGTRLATLMLANNETGAIQPVAELARLAAARGVPVHTDAVQAVGRIPVDFRALGVTTLAVSAHKLHGPAGIGVLLVREGTRLERVLRGGAHERGRRPGTVPVALCVGMATALSLWEREMAERMERWRRLTDRLLAGLREALPGVVFLQGPVDPAARLPQTINVGLAGVDGNALLMQLDLAGVCVSLGAACASGTTTPSATLVAMGVPADRLRSSIRISLGATTTDAEVEEALRRIVAVIGRLVADRGPARREG